MFETTSRISHALGAALLGILVLPGPASAAGLAAAQGSEDAIVLAPHRAVYDLKLADTRGKQSLEAARGRILYDFVGSPCEGYALQFRQVTALSPGEGKTVTSDLRSTNWEEGNGDSYRFTSENLLNGNPVDKTDGNAERRDGEVRVKLTKPEERTVDLGHVVFPSDQLRRIIAAAREGKTLLEVPVYDGSDNGQKVYNTTAVIGRPLGEDQAPDDAAAGQQALAGLKRWPVTVSYFDRAKADSDQTPAYSIGFELYENGVARALKLDYGDFVLAGKLSALDMKPAKACP